MKSHFIQLGPLFSAESPEYHALRAWLAERTTVLVPQHRQIVAEAGE